jgi:hypothetical protein
MRCLQNDTRCYLCPWVLLLWLLLLLLLLPPLLLLLLPPPRRLSLPVEYVSLVVHGNTLHSSSSDSTTTWTCERTLYSPW